jgi:hypothetical protein
LYFGKVIGLYVTGQGEVSIPSDNGDLGSAIFDVTEERTGGINIAVVGVAGALFATFCYVGDIWFGLVTEACGGSML